MKSVLFVCMGNVHRSVIAEHRLRSLLEDHGLLHVEVRSCGIQGSAGVPLPRFTNLRDYPDQWRASLPVLTSYGIDMSNHVARPVTRELVENADVVIAMDRRVLEMHVAALRHQFPDFAHKMHLFDELCASSGDVDDVGESDNVDTHTRVVRQICETLSSHIDELLTWLS